MIFKQLFDTKSSTYTYLIASAKGREAIIIDPVLENVDEYITHLKELDLKLVKVIDTHIHADHITGASKLKSNTNCTTIMGENSPAETVDIKLKDDEIIEELETNTSLTSSGGNTNPTVMLTNHLFEIDLVSDHLEKIKYELHDKKKCMI